MYGDDSSDGAHFLSSVILLYQQREFPYFYG